MTHPPCGNVVLTGHVISSNQGVSLSLSDEKKRKEREPGFEVDKKLLKLEISERSVLGVRMGEWPLKRTRLANQVQGFRILDRWEAGGKKVKFLYFIY